MNCRSAAPIDGIGVLIPSRPARRYCRSADIVGPCSLAFFFFLQHLFSCSKIVRMHAHAAPVIDICVLIPIYSVQCHNIVTVRVLCWGRSSAFLLSRTINHSSSSTSVNIDCTHVVHRAPTNNDIDWCADPVADPHKPVSQSMRAAVLLVRFRPDSPFCLFSFARKVK